MANYKKVAINNLVITLSEVCTILIKKIDKLEERIELLENGEVRTQASTDAEFSGEVF